MTVTDPSASPSFPLGSAPVLLNPAPDGVSVVCALAAPATGWVEYGETAALGLRCDAANHGFLPYEERVLSFRLTGLPPGKTCFYRVHAVAVHFGETYKAQRGTAAATETRSFRTLDPTAATARFTVWNDTHQNKETLRQLIALHREQPSDFLLWNGDVTNDVMTPEALFKEYLDPTGRAYADATPLFFGRGNHDVRGKATRTLRDHHLPGPGGAHHYVIRQGPVACIVLDTGEDKPDAHPSYAGLNDFAAYRAAQRRWLERVIEEPEFRSAPFRVAVTHIPLFWDGEVRASWHSVWGGFNGWVCEDGRNQWGDLLDKAGVRFVISGHTHYHAWFPPNAEHSYGQLIGGGPAPEEAAVIRVEADRQTLRLTLSNLAGTVLIREDFEA